MRDATVQWLEDRSPALFLVAGAILVGYGTLNGVETFTDVAAPASVFFSGYVFAFLGLLGLYPSLAEECPGLARIGAGAATMGLVGVCLASLRAFGHLAGLIPEYPLGWWGIVLLVVVGFIAGYLGIGLAAIRSDGHSTTLGLVLVMPGVIIVLMLLHMVAGLEQPTSVFVVSSGQAMAHLAIGATLRYQSSQSSGDGRPETPPPTDPSDSTASPDP